MAELSPRAQKLLDALTESQRRAIRKDYPFKRDRNRAICELKERGVPGHLLAEAGGFSVSQIQRISTSEKGKNEKG
jgi:hypothetical protein